MFNLFSNNVDYLDFPKLKGISQAQHDGVKVLSYSAKGEVVCVRSPKPWTSGGLKQYYFEVSISSPGEKGTIAIGVSQNETGDPTNKQPGWFRGSFAYHADDGIAFCNDTLSINSFGPKWATQGAVVGCGVDFGAEIIFFTFPDGTRKTLPTHTLKEFPTKLYPMIGLHSNKESVVVNFGDKLPFTHDPFGNKQGGIPTTFSIPPKFQAYALGNTLTVSCKQTATLQANTFFTNLANVRPYFEVSILSLSAQDTLSIGYTDQICDRTQLVGMMQNSFGWQSNGKTGWNKTVDRLVSSFGKGDTIGCGIAFNSFNQRKVFLTLNGKSLGFINKTVATGMDCFPSLGFLGQNIKVRFNFGDSDFSWDIQQWPRHQKRCYMDSLPTETIQLIVEYSAHSHAFTAINLSAVNQQFNVLAKNNQIWKRLYYLAYPEQNPNLKVKEWYKFFRSRFSAMKKNPKAHPIEGCDFGYQCPQVLEELATNTNKTQMLCYKCNKDVYVVTTTEQLKQYVQLGRCVSFKIQRDNLVQLRGEPVFYQ
jgi:hypothetical protein